MLSNLGGLAHCRFLHGRLPPNASRRLQDVASSNGLETTGRQETDATAFYQATFTETSAERRGKPDLI